MFTTALKNLAVELNAFIMTSTQLSEQDNDKKDSWRDFHDVQGSKAIVNLVDFACIGVIPTKEELYKLDGLQYMGHQPNRVTNVYKNRRGRLTMCRIWSYHDLGTCRLYDLALTDRDLKTIEDFNIISLTKDEKETKQLEDFYNDKDVGLDMKRELEETFSYFSETTETKEVEKTEIIQTTNIAEELKNSSELKETSDKEQEKIQEINTQNVPPNHNETKELIQFQEVNQVTEVEEAFGETKEQLHERVKDLRLSSLI